MSDFIDRWGHITVGEALELNEIAELNKIAERTCGLEATAQTGGNDV